MNRADDIALYQGFYRDKRNAIRNAHSVPLQASLRSLLNPSKDLRLRGMARELDADIDAITDELAERGMCSSVRNWPNVRA